MKNEYKIFHREGRKQAINMVENLQSASNTGSILQFLCSYFYVGVTT